MAEARVGTSGWNYRGWRGSFYPDDLASKNWLRFYAERFNSVEVNYTFYRLPDVTTYEAWYRETPDHFRFVLKASRFITHIKRLRETRDAWDGFVKRGAALREKLGPILLQLPSSFKATAANVEAVHKFLSYAASAQRVALEFRDRSCFEEPMRFALRENRAALVIAHSSIYPMPREADTADFVYFRFHGPRKWCASRYTADELRKWANRMKESLASGRDVYAYFNNDSGGHAPPNARDLAHELGRWLPSASKQKHFPDSRA